MAVLAKQPGSKNHLAETRAPEVVFLCAGLVRATAMKNEFAMSPRGRRGRNRGGMTVADSGGVQRIGRWIGFAGEARSAWFRRTGYDNVIPWIQNLNANPILMGEFTSGLTATGAVSEPESIRNPRAEGALGAMTVLSPTARPISDPITMPRPMDR